MSGLATNPEIPLQKISPSFSHSVVDSNRLLHLAQVKQVVLCQAAPPPIIFSAMKTVLPVWQSCHDARINISIRLTLTHSSAGKASGKEIK